MNNLNSFFLRKREEYFNPIKWHKKNEWNVSSN